MATRVRGGKGKKGSELEKELEACVAEYLRSDALVNIVSAVSLAFTKCFERYEGEESYVPLFSRVVSKRLYSILNCSRLKSLFSEVSALLDEIREGLEKSSYVEAVYEISFTTISRLSIHTRSPYMPLEIGVSWDPVLNVPYIPSSSIKGISRHYFMRHNTVLGEKGPDEIFGAENKAGIAILIDAYPVDCKNVLIEPDVITPHYSEVSGSIDEPSSRPIPIVFPTIARGVTFKTIVAFRHTEDNFGVKHGLSVVEKIGKALEEGIGAKTAVGYGRIKIIRRSSSWVKST